MKKYFERKRIMAALLATILTMTSLPLSVFAGNNELITNGSFEKGSLDNWTVQGDVTTSSDSWLSGYYAELSGESQIAILQSDEAEANAEGNYIFTASVRAYEGSILRAQILQYSESGESAAGAIEVPISVEKGKWQDISYIFHTAADVSSVAVYFENSAGYADVDNVSVKLTSKYPVYEPEGTTVEVKNGDFTKGLESWTVSGEAITAVGFKGHGVKLQAGTTVSQKGIKLEADSLYELHYYVKAENAAECESGISISYKGENDELQTVMPYVLSGNSSAEGWQEVTAQFTTTYINGKATIQLFTEGEQEATSVAFDEVVLTQVASYGVQSTSLETTAVDESETNLYSNGAFVLNTAKVQYNQSNFKMTDGFSDGMVKWATGDEIAAERFEWLVESGTEHGNALKVTGKAGSAGTNLQHNKVTWKSGKTYVISFWMKTGSTAIDDFYVIVGGGTTLKTNTKGETVSFRNQKIENWTHYVFEINATDTEGKLGNDWLRFNYTLKSGAQTVWLADVKVVEKQKPAKRLDNGTFTDGVNSWIGVSESNVANGTVNGAKNGNVLKVQGGTTIKHDIFTEALEVGQKYTFKFRMRNNALSGARLASVYFVGNNGKIMESSLNATHGVWKEYVLDYVAQTGDEKPQLMLDLTNASGKEFVFADFSFAEYAPILSNGDFAEGEKDWTVFSLGTTNEGYGKEIVTDDAEHGKVMKISKNALDTQITDLRHTALSGDNLLTIGQNYKISFAIKTIGDDASYSLQLRDGTSAGAIIAYTGGNTNGDWKKVEYEYTVTEGYDDLQVWIRANPLSGSTSSVTEYYIDNVTIERQEKSAKGDSEVKNSNYALLNGSYPESWGLLGTDQDQTAAYAGGAVSAKVKEFYLGVRAADDTVTAGDGLKNVESGKWTKQTLIYTAKNTNEKISFMYTLPSKFQTVYLADVQVRKNGTGENLFTTFDLNGGVQYGDENFAMNKLGSGTLGWPNPNADTYLTWCVVQDEDHGNTLKVNGSASAGGYWLWQPVVWEVGATYEISYWVKTGTTAELTQEAAGYVEAKNNSGTEVGASTLLPVYEGAQYTLKFWMKANKSARESFKLRLTKYKDQDRNLITDLAQTYADVQLSDSDGWQQVKAIFTVEKGTGYMDLSFLTTKSGSAFRLSGVEVMLDEISQKNAGFEVGDVGEKPVSWSFGGSGVFVKDAGGCGGDYAGHISNGNTGHLTGATYEVESGTYYEMSYWVKKDAPYDNMIYPLFKQIKEDGTSSATANITFPWTIRVYGSTDGEWKQVRYFFKTADDAAGVTFNLVISGAFDDIWIDRTSMEKKAASPNLDFEEVDTEGNPEGWYLTDAFDADPVIRTDSEHYHSGNSSVYLKVNNLIEEQELVNSYRFPVTATGDKRLFEHSFWVASRNADIKSVQLNLKFYDESGNALTSGATRNGIRKTLNAGKEISEWSQVIVRSEIPQNAKYVQLVFWFTQGKAELWIDDIYFDQVESDTEVVAAHNDFHAVDDKGQLAEWTITGGTLVQKSDEEENFFYGELSGGTMTYTTDTLTTEYHYKASIRYKSDTHVNAAIRFYDYHHQEYADVAVIKMLPASASWRTADIEFTAPSCTTCDIVLGNDAVLEVSELIIYQTAKPSTKPSWTGKWIAYRADYRWCTEYDSSYYRKKITLNEKVTKAPFQITADDKFALWVNGKELYNNINDSTGTWAAVQVLDLTDYLKVGDNIIAIEVYNQGAYSGLIFDGIWTLESGKTADCISGADTLCMDPTPSGDWKTYDYNDTSWSRSIVIGSVPINPWGDVYFDATLYIDNTIEVEPVEGEGVLVNDLEYEFSVKMKINKAIDTQLPFNAILWRRNSITSICTMPITLVDHKEMREWPVGEWFIVKMKVELPDYIDDGNYTLQLSTDYFAITSENVYDNKFISFKVVNDYVPVEHVSKVEMIGGTPTLTIDGNVASQFWWKYCNNMSSALSTIGESDFEIYITQGITIGEGEGVTALWNENGTFDYDSMDSHLNTVLAASQNANIIVQIKLYAPSWWLDENPDEVAMAQDANGNLVPQVAASFGSEKWKKQAGELLKDIIAHMRQQKYYSRVVGVRLIAGQTDEFVTYGSDVGIPDYSPAALQFFRKWAKEEYGTIENLRQAWNDDRIESFDSIELPTYQEMNADGGVGVMYDPLTQQKCVDFSNLLGEMVTDSMLYWAQIAKEATDSKLVIGAYYGYLFAGFGETIAPTSLEDVLNSSYIDFLCGPALYNERQLGESPGVQQVTDTIRAYGKLAVTEQDNRTVLCNQFAGSVWDTDRAFSVGHTFTMEDSILQEKRDATYNIVNGNASYTYDMQGGWLNDTQLYDLFADVNDEYYVSAYAEENLVNDVALIIPDENSSWLRYDDGSGAVNTNPTFIVLTQGILNWHRRQLARMGTGYDIYALSTLEEGKMPQHKINIFFTPFYLSDEQRALIDQHCKKDGQINIFFYMSGMGSEEGADVENMSELTGFNFEYNTSARSTGQIEVVDSQTQITDGVVGNIFGTKGSTVKYYVHEVSVKEAEDQTVLGRLRDSGKIGFAMKDMGDWISIYCAAPNISGDVYRNILKMAGVHIYSDNPSDIIWSNSGYVGVHSATSGEKTIHLPGNYAVYDVFEENMISMDTDTIVYENEVNDTHLFRLMPVNKYAFLSYVKGGNGTLSETGLTYLSRGDSKTITVTPNEGYMIRSVTLNGTEIEVGADNTVTVADISSNHTLVVRFKRVPCSRTLDDDSDNTKGTITNVTTDDTEEAGKQTVKKDAYQELWATVRDIISIPWWLLLLCGSGTGGIGFLIRFLIMKWKERRI